MFNPAIQMVCPRDYVLRTKQGHTISFEAGVPTPVPAMAYQEALSRNILPAAVPAGEKPAFEMATAEITGTLRDALVFAAIETIFNRNNVENFTGGGMPKPEAVTAEIGVAVSGPELSKYWARFKELRATNEELPTHPNIELVRELQSLNTRKQLVAFAADIGAPPLEGKGRALSEVKSALLYSIVNQQQAPMVGVSPDDAVYVKPSTLEED